MRTWIACCLIVIGVASRSAGSDSGISLETLRSLKDATVYVKTERDKDAATGSGFLVRVDGDTGYIVTNHHVVTLTRQIRHITYPARTRTARGQLIPGAVPTVRIEEQILENPTVTVIFSSGTRNERSFPGEVIASDRRVDLAIIKIHAAKDLPRPIDLKQEVELSETLPVFALGFPLGQLLATGKGGPAISISKGTITSIRRNDRDEVALVQIDSDLNPGNSGGPVVDGNGRLIGIAVAKVRDTRLGLAIPTRELLAVLAGRPGEARFEQADWRDIHVEINMVDPFDRVREVTFYYAPSSAVPETSAEKFLAGLKESHSVVLKREGRKAVGKFHVDAPDGGELRLAYQVTWTGADGKLRSGQRLAHTIKGLPENRPAPEVATPTPTPAPEKPGPTTEKSVMIRPVETRPPTKSLTAEQLTRALADLLDRAKVQAAADLLARSKPDDGRRAEVVKALRAVATEKALNTFARSHAISALGMWGSEKEVDFLVELAAENNLFIRRESIEALGRLGGAKAAETLVDYIEDTPQHAHVLRGLERIGSAAEDAIAASLLGNSKASLRMDGCNLLKSIGTDRTLHFVEDLARDDASDAVRLTAANAVKAIKDRQKAATK